MDDLECRARDCDRQRWCSTDWCRAHYQRWWRYGDIREDVPLQKRGLTLAERFHAKVDQDGPDGCWLWAGCVSPAGYGRLGIGRDKTVYAHRVSYELHIGVIPEGLTIDHLCRNRRCVNPVHLEAVTLGENTRRGMSATASRARNLARTHCKRGHPFDEANTGIDSNGVRRCRACGAAAQLHRYWKRKAG